MAAPFFVLNIAHFRWIKKLPVKTPQAALVRPGNGLVTRDVAKAKLALSPFFLNAFPVEQDCDQDAS